MMKIILPLTALILFSLFLTNTHGYIGAIVLGLSAIAVDFFWQWLRLKFVNGKTSRVILGVFGGLALRVLSIFLFMKLAIWWLGFKTDYFIVFAVCLLLIPFLNVIMAFIYKQEGNHKDA